MPYVYAWVSHEEHANIKAFVKEQKQSQSDFVRDCINRRLADEGDEAPLLIERKWGTTGPAPRTTKVTPGLVERMCRLREERRLTYREIGAMCGVSESTAHRVVSQSL